MNKNSFNNILYENLKNYLESELKKYSIIEDFMVFFEYIL